jgi:hypothetical protein
VTAQSLGSLARRMAKGKGQQPAAAGAAEDATLANDVKAFASKLGFSSVGDAFAYDDFAPQAAKKPLAAAAKQQKQPPAAVGKKRGRKEASQPGVKPQKHPAGKPRRPAAADEDSDDDDEGAAAGAPAAAPDPIKDRKWVESVGPRPGAGSGKSLLGRDEPTIWYEAAAGLPPLKDADTAGPPLDEAAAAVLRQRAEALLDHEAAVFEKDLARRNSGDTRWLAQVRRSGTTSDKVAAMTLLVQVRQALRVCLWGGVGSWGGGRGGRAGCVGGGGGGGRGGGGGGPGGVREWRHCTGVPHPVSSPLRAALSLLLTVFMVPTLVLVCGIPSSFNTFPIGPPSLSTNPLFCHLPPRQESVLGNLRSLDGLLALLAKRSGGRDVVGKSLEALAELWGSVLLPHRWWRGAGDMLNQPGDWVLAGSCSWQIWWWRRITLRVGILKDRTRYSGLAAWVGSSRTHATAQSCCAQTLATTCCDMF